MTFHIKSIDDNQSKRNVQVSTENEADTLSIACTLLENTTGKCLCGSGSLQYIRVTYEDNTVCYLNDHILDSLNITYYDALSQLLKALSYDRGKDPEAHTISSVMAKTENYKLFISKSR